MTHEPTKEELYDEAKQLDVEGRSTMNKDELGAAVEQAKAGGGDVAQDGTSTAGVETVQQGSAVSGDVQAPQPAQAQPAVAAPPAGQAQAAADPPVQP